VATPSKSFAVAGTPSVGPVARVIPSLLSFVASHHITADNQPVDAGEPVYQSQIMYLTYTLAEVRPGQRVTIAILYAGQPVPVGGSATTVIDAAQAVYSGVYVHTPAMAGEYRAELTLDGAAQPSGVVTFTVTQVYYRYPDGGG